MEEQATHCGEDDPNADNDDAGRAADRPILRGRREFAMFGHHVRRNQVG